MGPTTLLLHAPERQPAMIAHPNLTVQPLESAPMAIETIRTASVVVTGRIHACLVSLVLGVPFIFLGPWYDSRYSLLDYLGIPLEPPVPRRVERLVTRLRNGGTPSDLCLERVSSLRAQMVEYLREAGAPFGLGPVLGDLRGRGYAAA
jgi:polysaccharide pyruvyl transferase WcaK-like protein